MAVSTSSASAVPVAARSPRVPIRTCVGCRRRRAKPRLLRMVSSGGTVEVDYRAPGRGAYVCPDEECLRRALHKRGAPIARALRGRTDKISVDEETLAAAVAAAHGDRRREGVST